MGRNQRASPAVLCRALVSQGMCSLRWPAVQAQRSKTSLLSSMRKHHPGDQGKWRENGQSDLGVKTLPRVLVLYEESADSGLALRPTRVGVGGGLADSMFYHRIA